MRLSREAFLTSEDVRAGEWQRTINAAHDRRRRRRRKQRERIWARRKAERAVRQSETGILSGNPEMLPATEPAGRD
jgi:hypothetical protein